jgi:competence protein ComEC
VIAAAIWLGLLLEPRLALAIGLPILGLGAWLTRSRKRSPWPELALCGLLLAVAGVRGEAARRAHARAHIEPGLHRVTGVIDAPPDRASGTPAGIVRVTHAAPAIVRGARLRLRFPERWAGEWGDRVEVLAELDPPSGPRNPGQYDPRVAAYATNVAANGRARVARVLEEADRAPWVVFRRAIEQRFERHLSRAAQELVVPLVVGDRSGLSSDLDAGFRASGLIHLLALSGLHVSWMAGVLRGLAAWAGLAPRARAIAGALAAWAYVAIAGPIPSLLRAAAAETLTALARILGRASDPVQVLAIAAAALLIVFPGWAWDLGFQLSVVATLGLATLGASFQETRRRWPLIEGVTTTLSAQVCALPLLLAATRGLSWVAPGSNLIAVPLSGLLLSSAWIAVVTDLISPGWGRPWFAATDGLALAFRFVTEHAALPGAVWVTGPHAWKPMLAGAGAVLLAIASPPPRSLAAQRRGIPAFRRLVVIAGLACTLVAVVGVALTRPIRPPPGRWWLVMLDVGQGEAIAIGGGAGWWLVDAGGRSPLWDAGERRVVPFLRWAGIARLEGVAITHDDADHAGGALAVRRAARPRRWWTPAGASVHLPRGVRAIPACRGDTLWNAPAAAVVWPPCAGPRLSDNAGSLVLAIGNALLTADIDSTVERRLEVARRIAVLQVAHHGSRSASSEAFLAAIAPQLALISCGRHNPFGHPSPFTLERLGRSGATIHRTDEGGALWIELSERDARVLDWRHDQWRQSRTERSLPGPPRR